ncbi:MAG TPA: SDR family NAD(P)-dependent oxidoreductase [Deinococcales bacterium]|nr:SDR family NAD(P)-dependent oxidoreductase [Deinococcales bacterium]
MPQLDGKVGLVTGAGSGIGKAAALRLAREGMAIGALDHTDENASKTADEITSAGGKAIALTADVSDPAQVKAAADRLASELGRIDFVFANAGINGVWAPLEELEPDEWDRTLDINLKGTFLTVKYAVPYLKRQGGSIVVTSSVNGTRIFSNTGATAYSSSKAAQVAFTQMIALELAKWRIRANVICPGAIETNIGENTEQRDLDKVKVPVEFPEGNQPLTGGEPGSSEEVADLVLFLASDASKHISGTPIWIDATESLLLG